MSFDLPHSFDPKLQAKQQLEDASVYAKDAIGYDQDKRYPSALFFYQEAVSSLLKAHSLDPTLKDVQMKAKEYLDRADIIKALISGKTQGTGIGYMYWYLFGLCHVFIYGFLETNVPYNTPVKDDSISELETMLDNARLLEQQGKLNKCLILYQQAGEIAIAAARATKDLPEERKSLRKRASYALEGAERAKMILKERKESSQIPSQGGLRVDHLVSYVGEHTRHEGPTQRVAPNKLLSYLDTDTTPYQVM